VNLFLRPARWPAERFSTVQPAWEGETCCVIGCGPSLTQKDVDLTWGHCRVIAVNDAYRMAPWADVCYFSDLRWWKWHAEKPQFQAFRGAKCSVENGIGIVPDTEVHVLHNHGTQGLSLKPDGVMTGQHGGYAAINFAVLAGCKRVLLLGFDMHNGRHWFGQHPVATDDNEPKAWLANYVFLETPLTKAGVEVVNCSPGSALTRFPMMPIEKALCAVTA
jgi:hypothetical protein